MKKLLVFLFVIGLTTTTITAQRVAMYASYQPTDVGMGLRIDYYIFKDIGFYNSVTYGDGYLYYQYNLRYHTKYTMGILFPLPDYHDSQYDLSFGLNYHTLKYDPDIANMKHLNQRILEPWSFELGVKCQIKHIVLGLRTDIPRWEPCVDFGITIWKNN